MNSYDAIAQMAKLIPDFDMNQLITSMKKVGVNTNFDSNINNYDTKFELNLNVDEIDITLTYCGHERNNDEECTSHFADGSSTSDYADISASTYWIYGDDRIKCDVTKKYEYGVPGNSGGVDDYNCKNTSYRILSFEDNSGIGEEICVEPQIVFDIIKATTEIFALTSYHRCDIYLNAPINFVGYIKDELKSKQYIYDLNSSEIDLIEGCAESGRYYDQEYLTIKPSANQKGKNNKDFINFRSFGPAKKIKLKKKTKILEQFDIESESEYDSDESCYSLPGVCDGCFD